MNKRKSVVLVFITLTISAIFHFLDIYHFFRITPLFLAVTRWIFIAFLALYGLYKRTLTSWILISMAIGVEIGLDFPQLAVELKVISQVFLRLVKTIIAPILFSTLVVGIAGHSNLRQVGRMGWKSLVYFELLTTVALFIGLLAINISQAGVGIHIPPGFHEELPAAVPQTWQDIVLHIFPDNIIKAMYDGDVLPIVVFSVLFGIGLALVKEEKRKPMLKFSESLAETMFKFTNLIMYFAPFGVGAAIAVTVSNLGLDILYSLIKLLLTLYASLVVFIGVVLVSIAYFVKIPLRQFIRAVSEPVAIAFATTSSESALPIAMENMEKFGVPRKIVSFVLPTGYTFNLDGTTLYLSLASVFVAQAAGIHLSFSTQIIMGFTLMLTSKGVAGVPRAALVILLATVSSYGLPLWPVLAILGIDVLMDMARTSVNVVGNTLASCVVAKWEGEFDQEKALAFKAE